MDPAPVTPKRSIFGDHGPQPKPTSGNLILSSRNSRSLSSRSHKYSNNGTFRLDATTGSITNRHKFNVLLRSAPPCGPGVSTMPKRPQNAANINRNLRTNLSALAHSTLYNINDFLRSDLAHQIQETRSQDSSFFIIRQVSA